MPLATITSKGQVTIPKAIRDRLELRTGDRLSFHVRADGTLEVHVVTGDLRELHRLFKATHPVSIEEMDEAIGEGATD